MYSIESYANGFDYLVVQNDAMSAKIALQGAHIFEYLPKGKENLLWLSNATQFEAGSAIRGGIPLCWPRFGNLDKSLPQHGFARTALFELLRVEEISKEESRVVFLLKSDEKSREIWPFSFRLEVTFVLSDTLSISMTTTNLSEEEMMLSEAFHTYFRVDGIENVVVEGLEDVTYIDTLCDTNKVDHEKLRIDQEVDRVYIGTQNRTILLHDAIKTVAITTEGSNSSVVWNPWIEKCAKMSGMDPQGYKEFLCIESANAFDDFRLLESGASHTLRVHYKEV